MDPTAALVSVICYAAVFVPLELSAALHRRRLLRSEVGTDALFIALNFLLWTPLIVALLLQLSALIATLPLHGLRRAFSAQWLWLQLIEAILLSDLAIYWFHRACHRCEWLWRFHAVHHGSRSLDWLAAYREHPLDNLATRVVENVPLMLLAVPLPAIAGFAVFRGMWSLFIHANVDLSPGPLRFILGAPRLHHWHHQALIGGQCNFGNLDPLMDLIFGTYRDPGRAPWRYGIRHEPRRGYLSLLVRPFLPPPQAPAVVVPSRNQVIPGSA
jgi:sterol desaturase/sphingolipid hydroxylase (fatty acid hydroxylase superfamily)